MWDSLAEDDWTLLGNEREKYCDEAQGNAVAFSLDCSQEPAKADLGKRLYIPHCDGCPKNSSPSSLRSFESNTSRYRNQSNIGSQIADHLQALSKTPTSNAYGLHFVTGNGRGVHSVRRSGIEQRSFAHTILPLGALSLPLSDVERKQRAR